MAFTDDGMKQKLNERLLELQGKTVPIEQEKEAERIVDILTNGPKEVPKEVETNLVNKSNSFNLIEQLKLLDKEAQWAYSFPIEFKKAMVGLKMLHNCSWEFSAVTLLGYTNVATHHLYDVDSHIYGVRPSSLFVLSILQTGGLKSTIGGELCGPFNDFIQRWTDVFKDEDYRYKADMNVFKKEMNTYEKEKEEGLSPDFPKSPMLAEKASYKMKNATQAGVLKKLKRQPFVNLVTPEGVGFFKGHAFQDATRALQMSDTLIDLWDGSTLRYDLKEEDDSVNLANRRFNMTMMVQHGPIAGVLNNEMFQEQGFIHRILLANIKPFPKKLLNEDDPEQDDKDNAIYRDLLKPYLDRLTELFDKRWTIKKDFQDDTMDFELDPQVKRFTISARKMIAKYYNISTEWGNEGNRLERYEGFAQRIHEQACRIACTLSAFRNGEGEIGDDDTANAIEYMEMFIHMRLSITRGMIDSNPTLTNNSKILAHWFESRKGEKFCLRDLNRVAGKCPEFAKLKSNSGAQKDILASLLGGSLIIAIESVAKNGHKLTEYMWNNDGDTID